MCSSVCPLHVLEALSCHSKWIEFTPCRNLPIKWRPVWGPWMANNPKTKRRHLQDQCMTQKFWGKCVLNWDLRNTKCGDILSIVSRHTRFLIGLITSVEFKIVIIRETASTKDTETKLAILTLYRRSADCFVSRPSPYRAVNTFQLGYKNHSVYDVRGTSRCLFSDQYKTHKYNVGRAYNCWTLIL